jgi:hypothetical protein
LFGGKEFKTPVLRGKIMIWWITGSCNGQMITLFDNVNVSANSDYIKNEQMKHLQENGIDEINMPRTSVRQRKVPVTRREDILWKIPHWM